MEATEDSAVKDFLEILEVCEGLGVACYSVGTIATNACRFLLVHAPDVITHGNL